MFELQNNYVNGQTSC